MKYLCMAILTLAVITLTAGCEKIQPDPSDGIGYATQTSVSSLEYSIFLDKQVSIFIDQIFARLDPEDRGQEMELTSASLKLLDGVLGEVAMANPPTASGGERKNAIYVMETALSHVRMYLESMEKGNDVTGYREIFKDDIAALMSIADLYAL